MTTRSDFDDIRPYNDSELTKVLGRLVGNKEVLAGIAMVMPKQLADKLVLRYKELRSVDQFQEEYMFPMLEHLKDIKSTAITYSGSEYVRQPALFLSNHRDIIIDPAFLQYVLLKCGMKTSEIAIGSNLMAKPWITDAMRVNKSFVVRRNLTRGEQISAFGELSRYIAHTITQKRASIWLAQREGRAKDSDDRTQISLLKMLSLSGEGSFVENIKKLRLHPLAISYEYDVCDYIKAKELQQRRDDENFIKSATDDVLSMQIGALGSASEIHYAFTPPIDEELDRIAAERLPRNEEVRRVAEAIDTRIHRAYKIFKTNYIAFDLAEGGCRFGDNYTKEEKDNFSAYIDKQTAKIDLRQVDKAFCREKILEMYANPLKNKIAAEEHRLDESNK